jgi:chromosome segregation ATPase
MYKGVVEAIRDEYEATIARKNEEIAALERVGKAGAVAVPDAARENERLRAELERKAGVIEAQKAKIASCSSEVNALEVNLRRESELTLDTSTRLTTTNANSSQTKKHIAQLRAQLQQRDLQLRTAVKSLELEKSKCRRLESILETRLRSIRM